MNKCLLLVMFLLLSTANAWATKTASYSSNLHFGEIVDGTFTETPLYNGELRAITSTSAAMEIVGGKSSGTPNAVTLYLGVLGGTSALPEINGVTGSFVTNMISGQDAYTLLGATGANNSQSYANWSKAYTELIGTMGTDYFALYKFNMNPSAFSILGDGGAAALTFDPALEAGTFIFGDIQFDGKRCFTDYVTPFTTAGMSTTPPDTPNTPVPEPSTFILLGAGLAGLGLVRRRAKK